MQRQIHAVCVLHATRVLGVELEGLSPERLDQALTEVENLERAAVRHLELALDRGVDLVLVYGPEEGERLGRGGEAQRDVLWVELVVVNLDGDQVLRVLLLGTRAQRARAP